MPNRIDNFNLVGSDRAMRIVHRLNLAIIRTGKPLIQIVSELFGILIALWVCCAITKLIIYN